MGEKRRVACRALAMREHEMTQGARRRRRDGAMQRRESLPRFRQPLRFDVGQAQHVAQPSRVLRNRHSERGQPERGVGAKPHRRFDLGQSGEARDIGDAGEQRAEQTGLRDFGHRLGRAARDDHFEQFGAHPLPRQGRKPVAQRHAGRQPLRVERPLAVSGVKAEEAQDAQIIFGDAPARIADEAHAPRQQIRQAADGVVQRAVARQRQGVHGEIAPPRVGVEIPAIAHDGAAPVRLDILAQGGDFERRALHDQRHRAVIDAGGNRLDAGGLGPRHHLLRRAGRRNVHVCDGQPHQRVAQGAADDARRLAAPVERRHDARRSRLVEQGEGGCGRSHSSLPGTNLPFSICAGT